MIAVALVIGFSGSAPQLGTDGEADTGAVVHISPAPDNKGAVTAMTVGTTAAPVQCPSARRAVRFYGRRLTEWRARLGARAGDEYRDARIAACPRYLAKVLKHKAAVFRRLVERWNELRTLQDFAVRDGNRAWHRAVREAQRPYPSTEGWLLSCSASEGGHGRWVPNGDGSGAGGWLQFMSGTFWRMWSAARLDVVRRGFLVPRSAADWHSPLGQALAGAWGVTHGRSHEWYGGGC